MPSVRILHDFLLGEDEWELIQSFQVTSFFRRKRETVNEWDWADQKINNTHLARYLKQSNAGSRPQGIARSLRALLGR
jgi:hypothetical protein